jgi:hypothetical protein
MVSEEFLGVPGQCRFMTKAGDEAVQILWGGEEIASEATDFTNSISLEFFGRSPFIDGWEDQSFDVPAARLFLVFGALFSILVWPKVTQAAKHSFKSSRDSEKVRKNRQSYETSTNFQKAQRISQRSWTMTQHVAQTLIPGVFEERYTLKSDPPPAICRRGPCRVRHSPRARTGRHLCDKLL